MLRLFRAAHDDGLLLEISLQNGENLAGYWLTSIGSLKIRLANSTLEEVGEEEIVALEDIARVNIL